MILPQLLNAISMLAPLYCLWRHRKKRSLYKPILCIHIPISICYHACMAFPASQCRYVIASFKILDFLFIHVLSLASRLDFKRYKTLPISILLHSVLFYQSAFAGKDRALLKCALMGHDNIHLISRCQKPRKLLQLVMISLGTCFLYYTDTQWDYGHAIFHVMLYSLFDTYFNISN